MPPCSYIIRFLPAAGSVRGDVDPFVYATEAERDELLARWAEACGNLGIRAPQEHTDYELIDNLEGTR